jgi:hypothetical protein
LIKSLIMDEAGARAVLALAEENRQVAIHTDLR